MGAVPPADDELDAELTTLRLRAYGPDAEIDAGPIAQTRLADPYPPDLSCGSAGSGGDRPDHGSTTGGLAWCVGIPPHARGLRVGGYEDPWPASVGTRTSEAGAEERAAERVIDARGQPP